MRVRFGDFGLGGHCCVQWLGQLVSWSVGQYRADLTTVPRQPTEATPKILMTAHETH